jgi:hypothetical protein
MNPFISFCVYVAARVFVQYLKNRPKDQQMNSSLQFLLQAMQALRRRNPLTESFLVQLDIDLETAGLLTPDLRRFMAKSTAQVRSTHFIQHRSTARTHKYSYDTRHLLFGLQMLTNAPYRPSRNLSVLKIQVGACQYSWKTWV